MAIHFCGTCRFGNVCTAMSVAEGSGFSTQPESASATTSDRNIDRADMSVQLEDQIVDVRPDSQDHLANDVNVMSVVRVDRTMPGRAGGQEQATVDIGDAKLHCESSRHQRRG